MLVYVLRRLLFGAAVLAGTSIITFVIAFVIPADPAVTIAGAKADPQTLTMIRTQLGLDQPLYIQYARYLDRALHGDLGRSYIMRENVTELIAERFPATADPGRIRDGGVADPGRGDGIGRGRLQGSRGRPRLAGGVAGADFGAGLLARNDAADRRRAVSAFISPGRL